jgi:MoxR-like ATPase
MDQFDQQFGDTFSILSRNRIDLQKLNESVTRVKTELHKVVVGQHQMVDLLLAGLFTGGHVLLEGVPGIAKTLTAKMLARTLSVGFSRIQFTPDLMPTDVLGTSVFNMKTSDFTFNRGPIFSNIVLIDEINRSPAKTQAALFEVMEERQITVDGITYKMEYPFIVIATQNPIEQEGTYKLPEAQLDRFLFRVKMNYPSLDDERDILRKFRNDFSQSVTSEVQPVLTADEIRTCSSIIEQVTIKDDQLDYIAKIIYNTRNNGDLFLGASPRASLAILRSSKAIAAMSGRDFVTPDDIQYVAYPVLNHRIILTPEREMEGVEPEDIVKQIIQSIEVPR